MERSRWPFVVAEDNDNYWVINQVNRFPDPLCTLPHPIFRSSNFDHISDGESGDNIITRPLTFSSLPHHAEFPLLHPHSRPHHSLKFQRGRYFGKIPQSLNRSSGESESFLFLHFLSDFIGGGYDYWTILRVFATGVGSGLRLRAG